MQAGNQFTIRIGYKVLESFMTKIKICGLKRLQDIEYVNELLPDFIGFVFAGTKRRITDEKAKELKAALNPEIKSVGVFVNDTLEHISFLANNNIIDIIQLHGDEDRKYIADLRKLTDKKIIKAVRVKDSMSVQEAKELNADYLLLDTYSNSGEYGGTGKTFNRKYIPEGIGDYFLAGGLNRNNLEEIIKDVKPYAVDLSSGVETDGFKDREKIKKVIEIVRQ